jgi:MFS family permease
MLIIGRILEALSTGVLMPLLQTIAMTRFPENRHGTAMGVAGISLGFAPNVGPIIGGAIATAASWRFLFLVLSVASVVLILATLLVCNERQPKDPAAVLDPVSLLLSTCGFGGLLFGLTAAANMSVTSPIVWATILLGAVCVVAFVQRQKLSAHPLIRLGIFGTRQFRVSLLAQCALYGCFMGMTLIIPLEVIEGGGHTALEAGAVLFPGAVAAFVCEPMAGMASDRFGARRVSIFGGIFLLAGAASIVALPVDAPLWAFALTQTLRCVGLTTLIPTTTAYALAPLHADGLTTDGSATLIMCRQIFAAMATALMVMGIKTFNVCPGDTLGYTVALAISAALAVVCLTTVVATIKDK